MKKNQIILIATSLFIIINIGKCIAQPRAVIRHLDEENNKYKEKFPPVLKVPYPAETLGSIIQEIYKAQAKEICGIDRGDDRLYIPQEIISGYGNDRLIKTKIYKFPMSANNLMFLALTPKDIKKINDNTFDETEYVQAKKIVGINDNLVDFGKSVLAPISGFPSLYYQKSCGSYFVGNVNGEINAPIAEIKASLDAETRKTTSITTITGKFFSPLYLIFSQNTAQSVYAHLLLWEMYYNDYKQNRDANNLLYNTGSFISEFNGSLTNRSSGLEQSLDMNARLASNLSIGIVNIDGKVQAGYENKVSFVLKDFNTYIHKLQDNSLSYALTDLPRIDDINNKLQNSLSFKVPPSIDGYVTHLLPVEISRTLTGIPSSLCSQNSWIVNVNKIDSNIWVNYPSVVSIFNANNLGEYPECVCKITGYIKKKAIDEAISKGSNIDLDLVLNNIKEIDGKKLEIYIKEPSVKVTDAPKILPINSNVINAGISQIISSTTLVNSYSISFLIDDTGQSVKKPFKLSNFQIEYINKEQEKVGLSININNNINANQVTLDIKTPEVPKDYVKQNDLPVSIKIKFSIALSNGTIAQLATNTISLLVPDFVKIEPVPSKAVIDK